MKPILHILSLLFLSFPTFGQSSERPETIVIPASSLGEVSEVRKQILQNSLEDELKSHFRLISPERFEEAQEKAFEELDYEECTEDQCIMMIQEMLQVENVFHLQVLGEGNDTQLSLSWRTLDEKRKETDVCLGCATFQLNEKVGGLVEKLVGVKAGGLFVTVGDEGTILSSPNGYTWTSRKSGTSTELHGVTHGNGLFVTVGLLGTILTSPDGTSWNQSNNKEPIMLLDVTYGNDLFVAVGQSPILTSSDGTSWTRRSSGTSKSLYGVTYGNGIFVTVGWSGTILTSSDGILWTKRNSRTEKYLKDIFYGKGLFVTVGQSGIILTSRDGTTWTERTSGTSKR